MFMLDFKFHIFVFVIWKEWTYKYLLNTIRGNNIVDTLCPVFEYTDPWRDLEFSPSITITLIKIEKLSK